MERLRLSKKEQESILEQIRTQLNKNMRINSLKIEGKDFRKVDIKKVQKPLLLIRAQAYIKMFALVDICNEEIAWHGLVKRTKSQGVYDLYDIVTFPQIVSAAHVDTDDEKYTMWLQEKMMDENFPFNDMKCHGHSHVNMQVFSSATDDEYQDNMIKNAKKDDYYIFMILNKKRDIQIYLYDFTQNILFSKKDMDVFLVGEDGDDLLEWADKEIKKNITKMDYKKSRKGNWYSYGYGFKQK